MRTPTLLLLLATSFLAACASTPATSEWARIGKEGRLVYHADQRGNTIPDFSRAGYQGGGVKLPNVKTILTLEPQSTEDDGARIQAALDEVGQRPLDASGHRGAVLLKRGTYRVAGTLVMRDGGVVLRGEGDGEQGTIIAATGKTRRTFLTIDAPRAALQETPGARRNVTDAYVPWSAKTFSVESADGLKVGDRIVVFRPSTSEWITALRMDQIQNRPGAAPGSTRQWKAGDYDLHIERTITGLEGNRLTLDAPLMVALDARYGGGAVYLYTFPRIAECGIEHLRLVSEYERGKETSDEAHAWIAVNVDAVENAWVRNVTALHFSHAVQATSNALFTTIQDCRHLDPVSVITGSRRYSFHLQGQYGLVQRCYARESRHSYITGSKVRGPNVFLDSVAEQTHSDSGPHHRWAIGVLYDNIREDKELYVQDRQWAGSGHGWAGAQQVLWNCEVKSLILQQPPTGQNYAIGCIGELKTGLWSPDAPNGIIDSHGQPVAPRSLYLRQLEERLGKQAVAAIAKQD